MQRRRGLPNARARVPRSERPSPSTSDVTIAYLPSVLTSGASILEWSLLLIHVCVRWAYVVRHDIHLPDEYDEIYEDIEPFWGIDPRELANTQSMLETEPGLVTVAKTNTSVEIVRSTIPEADARLLNVVNKILALLRDVAHELPYFRFSLSPDDRPYMMSDWRIEQMAREAAANGTSTYHPLLHSMCPDICSPHGKRTTRGDGEGVGPSLRP